ncbi:hypothetical protein GCM10023084_10240 [Streptomyces lacrimifluminis]|uniref:Uncharacterized protein n=1 Tax=Streptomyces lacrimifluminis TaxID=1500077 RepID=A0A917L9H4_9ACTN|nr:hypothetical protein [Streptomyces lacrimifluminis]GGJ46626.1 hypothetical protein GCM10012282_49400 [Streptomyces lacrimifluminis]
MKTQEMELEKAQGVVLERGGANHPMGASGRGYPIEGEQLGEGFLYVWPAAAQMPAAANEIMTPPVG